MMYACKIIVDYKPKKVKYHREVELPDGLLTLNDISQHLKDGEAFAFEERQIGNFDTTMLLNIYGYRYETKEEVDIRVSKEELYNKNYEAFHLRWGKK